MEQTQPAHEFEKALPGYAELAGGASTFARGARQGHLDEPPFELRSSVGQCRNGGRR
jgi:hypothetical protein